MVKCLTKENNFGLQGLQILRYIFSVGFDYSRVTLSRPILQAAWHRQDTGFYTCR